MHIFLRVGVLLLLFVLKPLAVLSIRFRSAFHPLSIGPARICFTWSFWLVVITMGDANHRHSRRHSSRRCVWRPSLIFFLTNIPTVHCICLIFDRFMRRRNQLRDAGRACVIHYIHQIISQSCLNWLQSESNDWYLGWEQKLKSVWFNWLIRIRMIGGQQPLFIQITDVIAAIGNAQLISSTGFIIYLI